MVPIAAQNTIVVQQVTAWHQLTPIEQNLVTHSLDLTNVHPDTRSIPEVNVGIWVAPASEFSLSNGCLCCFI